MAMTKPEMIERFHLALLQVMPQHLPSANYVVKGGANLRLFMESVRRSEDIDFDFVGDESWGLRERMGKVFASPALGSLLAVQGVKITSMNPSKTTTTTGRWKLQLAAPGVQVNSKVEFSMRSNRPLYEMSSVSSRLAAAVGMRPAIANHYIPRGAIEQKIAALALRTQTQARDIFDLDFLTTRFPDAQATVQVDAAELLTARHRVFDVSYADYQELVVAFLDPDFVTMYSSETEWTRMVIEVEECLGALALGTGR
jgi:hypothetical protein